MDMPTEILLRPRRTDRRCDHLSEHHVPVPGQAQGAVTGVLEFDPCRLTGPHWHGLRVPLQRLDARHLVHADRVRVVLEVQFRGFQIALTDDLDLLLEQQRIFLGGVEPILAAMGLQFGLGQITVDLTGRDRRHDAAMDEFVGEFSPGPLVNRPARLACRFTGHGQNLRDLFGGEFA